MSAVEAYRNEDHQWSTGAHIVMRADAAIAELESKDVEHYEAWKKDMAAWKVDCAQRDDYKERYEHQYRRAEDNHAALLSCEAELAALKATEEAFKGSIRRNVKRAEKAEAELQAAQWALAQWHAEEDDWVRDRATLESELAALNDDLNVSKRLNAKWMDERTEAIMRAEGAEEALAVQRLPHSPVRMPRRGQVGQ